MLLSRVTRSCTLVLFFLLSGANLASVNAQVSIKLPPESSPIVEGLIKRGQELESQQRWGEALSFYENAHRNHPDQIAFEERQTVARIHYDLGRRYADGTFHRSLLKLSEADAVELYNQILTRIFAHYVTEPQWQKLIERGTMHMQVALTDPQFSEFHLHGRDALAIQQFRADMIKLSQRTVRNRTETSELAGKIARLANDRLAVAPAAVMMEYVSGAVLGLDDYSTFLTEGQLSELYSQIDGNFVGLGVELKPVEKQLIIVNVISKSPAERSGLKKGDSILEVDGKVTALLSPDKAADLLQGAEGTTANLVVQTRGENPRRILVRREQVEVPSVENAQILDTATGTAYFKLAAFQKTTAADIDQALIILQRQGMKSLIIDLRGNPGGLLPASVEAADRFLDEGIIVSTRGRNPQEDFTYTAHKAGTWTMPLVVLIDGDSASASEIFAGAMRDHHRATIIGERSFGKGTVQGIFPVNVAGTGIRLTTAKFYSPLGKPFSKVGVSPDIVVHKVAKPVAEVPTVSTINANQTPSASSANSSATLHSPATWVTSSSATIQNQKAEDPVIIEALRVARTDLSTALRNLPVGK